MKRYLLIGSVEFSGATAGVKYAEAFVILKEIW
jgi:hypothetical protein